MLPPPGSLARWRSPPAAAVGKSLWTPSTRARHRWLCAAVEQDVEQGVGPLAPERSDSEISQHGLSVSPEQAETLQQESAVHLASLKRSLAVLERGQSAAAAATAAARSGAAESISRLRQALQLLSDAASEGLPGAAAQLEALQNGLVDAGALGALVGLAAGHGVVEAWLAAQGLCFRNKKACALLIKDGLHARLLEVLLSHPEDVYDDSGGLLTTKPPSRAVVAAAFALSTLVLHNRQHGKLITPHLLRRLVRWIRGGDSSEATSIELLPGRHSTLQRRAISIARDLAVNAAMHDDLIAAGVPEALSASVASESEPRRKVASIVSICMLVDPNADEASPGGAPTGDGAPPSPASAIMTITPADLQTIMTAVNCSMREIACYGQEWRMWNLMLALQKLSAKEENRRLMLDYEVDIVAMLDVVLKGKYEMASLAQRYALLLAWNLSFDSRGAERLLASPRFVAAVEAVKDSTTSLKTLEAAKGVLFTLGQLNLSREQRLDGLASKAAMPRAGQHIMISYEWSHQQRVLVLKTCLEALGYRVWLDVQNMSGSTLEAMAHAVEDAAVVVCCVSRRYKNSQACRTEAEYAFQQRKRIIPVIFEKGFKPTGWLGALMGTRLYFTMNETYQVANATKRLSLELGDVCRTLAAQGDPAAPSLAAASPPKDVSGAAAAPPPPSAAAAHLDLQSAGAVQDWSPQEVRAWLTGVGLGALGERWERKRVDGLALQGLIELANDGSLRQTLVADLAVRDPVEMLHVVAQLGMLFNMGHR